MKEFPCSPSQPSTAERSLAETDADEGKRPELSWQPSSADYYRRLTEPCAEPCGSFRIGSEKVTVGVFVFGSTHLRGFLPAIVSLFRGPG